MTTCKGDDAVLNIGRGAEKGLIPARFRRLKANLASAFAGIYIPDMGIVGSLQTFRSKSHVAKEVSLCSVQHSASPCGNERKVGK
jgi:hypothetical protein